MTITREQLELAALAAWIDVSFREWRAARVGAFGALVHERRSGFRLADGSEWRPHLDDGDAARLQVLLNMDITVYKTTITATVDGWDDWASVTHDGTEPDKLRAWREAVVLCAAAVGKRMRGER